MKKILLFAVIVICGSFLDAKHYLRNFTNKYDVNVDFYNENNGLIASYLIPQKAQKAGDSSQVAIPGGAWCVKVSSLDPEMKISKDCLPLYTDRHSSIKSDSDGNTYILADDYSYGYSHSMATCPKLSGPYSKSCSNCVINNNCMLTCQCWNSNPSEVRCTDDSLQHCVSASKNISNTIDLSKQQKAADGTVYLFNYYGHLLVDSKGTRYNDLN